VCMCVCVCLCDVDIKCMGAEDENRADRDILFIYMSVWVGEGWGDGELDRAERGTCMCTRAHVCERERERVGE